MDIDALAREVADRFMRGDLAGPPFPPYFAHWMEHARAEAERIHAEYPSADDPPQLDWPPFESFEQDGYERIGDLDVYVYRIDPSASALLLALRGDALAYAAFAGMRFMGPVDPNGRFPLYDLAMMATRARAQGELDVQLSSMSTQHEGPIHVAFEIEPARYAALDDAARETLHRACASIAGDAALLFCGRPGPLRIVFVAPPDPPVDNVYNIGETGEPIAQFDVP
jgi:hypothetical protein